MGSHHGDKWRRALPWVLLGKRIAFQPDLDTSAALLAFGRSPLIPGQLLGEPGPPLTNLQVKALLEELYKLEAQPGLPTSSVPKEIDISKTDNMTHVYVKVEEPHGLAPRFEGPYEIVSRPSRTQVRLRVGSYVSGEPRHLTYHWSACKPAHMRPEAVVGERPRLGRRPKASPDPPSTLRPVALPPQNKLTEGSASTTKNVNKQPANVVSQLPVKIQMTLTNRPTRSTRNPSPNYVDAIVK